MYDGDGELLDQGLNNALINAVLCRYDLPAHLIEETTPSNYSSARHDELWWRRHYTDRSENATSKPESQTLKR